MRLPRRLHCLAALTALTAFSGAPSALAQNEDPGALLRRGTELRRTGHDAEALEVFRRALVQARSARARAQVGLAEEALGDWVAAEQDIAGASTEPDDGWIERNAVALEEALRDVRGHLATLDVRANVDAAELSINGKLRGNLPAASPVRVNAGETTVEIRARGYEPQDLIAVLPAGGELRQSVVLRASERAAPVEAVRPNLDAVGAAPPAPRVIAMNPPREDSSRSRAAGWALLGTSAGFLAAGLASQIAADVNAAAYNDDGRCLFGTLTRDQRCGDSRDRAESAQALAVAGYALGAVAGLASIVLLVTAHPGEHRVAAFACDASLAAVSCHGQF